KYLDIVGFATSLEIAEHRGVTHGCQSTLMLRYLGQDLVHRGRGEGKEKIYNLSERGHERLEWLEEQFEDQGLVEEQYFNFGPYINLKRCKVKNTRDSLDFLKNLKRCARVSLPQESAHAREWIITSLSVLE
ncbi:MAG: hypothetical protein ACW963_04665, partial [Candidatus Sifarchaeia archaeon]